MFFYDFSSFLILFHLSYRLHSWEFKFFIVYTVYLLLDLNHMIIINTIDEIINFDLVAWQLRQKMQIKPAYDFALIMDIM